MLPNPWVLLVAGGLWLASITGGYLKGHHDADQSATVARLNAANSSLTASLTESQRQLKATSDILSVANIRQAELDATSQKDQETIDAYAKELAERAACGLTDDDVRSLQFGPPEPRSAPTPLPPKRPGELR